jgi:hypothetical protein
MLRELSAAVYPSNVRDPIGGQGVVGEARLRLNLNKIMRIKSTFGLNPELLLSSLNLNPSRCLS